MIKKAVITAAGRGTRHYPATNAVQKEMFPLVDIDGVSKPVIQIIVEQVVLAGIEDVCIVVNPGESEQFRKHFNELNSKDRRTFEEKGKAWGLLQSDLLGNLKARITYIEQTEQKGFGHAVWCAHQFVHEDPFLLLLGDHVYVSETEISCIAQTLQGYGQIQKTLFPVICTPIEQLHLFGTLTGQPVTGKTGLYQVTEIIEKPNPETARKYLITPGLPKEQFFTFFGIYALSPDIMHILNNHVNKDVRSGGEIQLTPALRELSSSREAFAMEIRGRRLDMGTPMGYIETQIALARKGVFASKV